jgi:hypothetical protein
MDHRPSTSDHRASSIESSIIDHRSSNMDHPSSIIENDVDIRSSRFADRRSSGTCLPAPAASGTERTSLPDPAAPTAHSDRRIAGDLGEAVHGDPL